MKKQPKGPSVWYFISRIGQNRLDYLETLVSEYGDIVKLPSISPAYVINHPLLIEEILLNKPDIFTKEGSTFKRLERMIGKGLLTIQGSEWRFHRNLVTPTFHPKHFDHFVPFINQYLEQLHHRWAHFAEQGITFNIAEEMMLLVLHISGKGFFGMDLSEISSDIIHLIHKANLFASSALISASWLPTPGNIRYLSTKRKLDGLLNSLIDTHQHSDNELLGKLLHAVDPNTSLPFSRKTVLDEFKTILVTGHETTGSALCWLWKLLAENPECAKILQSEVDGTITGKKVSTALLDELPYTQSVIQETLRLYPPIWMIPRTVQQDSTIQQWSIPKGSVIFICPYAIHRHPKFWTMPSKFMPDRFGNNKKYQRGTYMPFGLGQRACIASQFTLLKMPLIVASIMKQYKIEILSPETIEREPLVSLRPKYGIWAKVYKRSSDPSKSTSSTSSIREIV